MPKNIALKMAIIEADTTQYALAELVGVDFTVVSTWVNGRRFPSTEQQKILAKALKKRVSDLFPEQEKATA